MFDVAVQQRERHEGALRLSVDSDFTEVAVEKALKILTQHCDDEGIKLFGDNQIMLFLRVGLGADLLQVIDVSRAYGLSCSFDRDFDDDEWEIYGLQHDNLKHIKVWSPGA